MMDEYNVLKPIRFMRDGKIIAMKTGKAAIPATIAKEYLRQGAIERYETKVIREVPLSDAGKTTPSSALPAGQVSQETTSKPSGRGGRRKKTEPSS
jgi:hypothetical protein